MKTSFSDYLKIVMYVIFGILLVISSYIIIININHYKSLSVNTTVSEIDNDYALYKENVKSIETFISNNKNLDNKTYLSIVKVLDTLKRSGVYRLIPKMKLNGEDLYELNDYFMEELINNCWISNLKELDINNKYQDTIMLLVNNSKYLNAIFINNSLTFYDNKLDNRIEDNYHFLLSNYLMYSKVILSICNGLGGIND